MKKLMLLLCVGLSAPHVLAADINAGQQQATACVACHGSAGISAIPAYPNLAGQKALYLEKQLKAFRDGGRNDPVMSSMAKVLTDTDISNLAAFFSSLK